MPKKGVKYNCPKKAFCIPADLFPLGSYKELILVHMRAEHSRRMSHTKRKE